MTHTTKDLPYNVLAHRSGIIDHDHRTGACVVGTYDDRNANSRARFAHRPVCPRYVYTVTCVHNNERDAYQEKVNTARASQKRYLAYFSSHELPADTVPYKRDESSYALTEMVEAGYFPNCSAPKTHTVDLREVDLGLIPGETISLHRSSAIYGFGYSRGSRKPDLLTPNYDETVECARCDELPVVTCIMTPAPTFGRGRYGCSCCTGENKDYPSRSGDRDEMNGLIKEYNTFGTIED